MINPEPLDREQIEQLLRDTAHQLHDLHPADVLTLAGFLAGSALQCWANDHDRAALTRGFVANLLQQLDVAPDNGALH